MIITYVAIVFLVAFFYTRLLYNYGQLWRAIPESKYQAKTKESIKPIRVSILIPFRNEANSLPNLIESLNRLNTFNIDVEVIFIDDHSTDDGQSYINDCRLSKKLIPLIHGTGKKEAIQLGWKHVSGEYIFQTDADCTITTSMETLLKMKSGDINPMMAVMSGKVKISGDMGLAMKLQGMMS